MKKLILCAAALMLILSLAGCTEPETKETMAEVQSTESTNKECGQLAVGKKIIEETKTSLLEQYDEAYFETDEYKAFVDGYWDGFWRGHKFCKICKENGDIPVAYLE